MSVSERQEIPTIDALSASNPAIDVAQLREISKFLAELRRGGVAPKEYSLALPYEVVRTRAQGPLPRHLQ